MEAIEGIQYPYALDKGGSIVKAVDAPRSEIYSCIACGERMVLRRGEIKRPYFAHYTENPNCTPETVLHKMAKDNIREGIDTALSLKLEYPVTWRCPVCNQEHKGNLTRSTREVKTEVSLDGVRPDILLISMEGRPLVAVEVIVTHRPEQEAIEAYKRLKLPVLMVKPAWEDLESLKTGLSEIEGLNMPCRALKCSKCNKVLQKIKVGSIYGYPCWKCGKKLRVLWFDNGDPYGQWSIQKSKIDIASKVGVELKWMYSKTIESRYIAHFCKSCGAIQGDFYIYDEPEWLYGIKDHKPERTVEFYYCDRCDTWIEKKRAVKSITALQTLTSPPREKGA